MRVIQIILIMSYLTRVRRCRSMEPFIVDGEEAKICNFPHSAHLSIKCVEEDKSESHFMCGSSILNHLLTLTAAHCTHGCTPKTKIMITVGDAEKRRTPVSTAYGFVNNKEYSIKTPNYDISLIRLKTAITFELKISRVAVMPNPPYFEEAKVAGWGICNEETGQFPDRLKFAKQYVLTKEECARFLTPKHTKDGTFCARSLHGYASRGDSGSALVVRDYIQIGIVSYKLKRPSKENRNVIVYTDVGYFYNWIRKNAEAILCADKR